MIEQQKKTNSFFCIFSPLKTCSKWIENMNANCRGTASLYGHQQQDAANGKYCYSSWGWACRTEAVWFQAFIQNLVVNSKRKLLFCLSLRLFYRVNFTTTWYCDIQINKNCKIILLFLKNAAGCSNIGSKRFFCNLSAINKF